MNDIELLQKRIEQEFPNVIVKLDEPVVNSESAFWFLDILMKYRIVYIRWRILEGSAFDLFFRDPILYNAIPDRICETQDEVVEILHKL